MKRIENIIYGTEALDLYLPDEGAFDLFIYFHGGGFEAGDKSGKETALCAPYLTDNGIALASCNYRMYPNATYPDFVRDAAAAVHWLSHHIKEYGICRRIFVGGSSAGGYLSMMLCFDGRWYAECGTLGMPVSGYFHDAGQPTCHFNVLRERGIDGRRVMIDDSAPLYHIGAAEEYPPMMLIVSDNDMKNRFEQIELVRCDVDISGGIADGQTIIGPRAYTDFPKNVHFAFFANRDKFSNLLFEILRGEG